jgi:hypothetical protein
MTQTVLVRWIMQGGYRQLFTARTAGDACDRCDFCERANHRGDRIWMNSYNDLYCDPCAHRFDASRQP